MKILYVESKGNCEFDYGVKYQPDCLKSKHMAVDFERSLICAIKSYRDNNKLDDLTYNWIDEMCRIWEKERKDFKVLNGISLYGEY